MSCMDLLQCRMPQASTSLARSLLPGPAYDFQKFSGNGKLHEPMDATNFSSNSAIARNGTGIKGSGEHDPSLAASRSAVTVTANSSDPDDSGHKPKETYINAKCVLLTYYSGDISSVVDEHFSRALSQPSSFSAADDAKNSSFAASAWKDVCPMSQRNLPASFWSSSYYPSASHAGASYTSGLSGRHDFFPESYLSSSFASGLADPWHYSLTSQTSSYHRHSYAMPQPAPTANRFSSCYGSFFPGHNDLAKSTESWASSRYSNPHPMSSSDLTHLGHSSFAHPGLTETGSKDLYWY